MTTSFPAHTPQEKHILLEVSDYHLIFDLNGVLVAMNEGQTRICLIVMRLGFKEFLSTCVKTFMVYIWSLAMKRNFSRHLKIIVEKTGVRLLSSKIVDQLFCLKNDHFSLEKLDKPIFHRNLFNFFVQFFGMTFENTLFDAPSNSLIDSIVSPKVKTLKG
jgi:hypothetical protein